MKNTQKIFGVFLGLAGVFCISPDALLIRLFSGEIWSFIFWRGLGMSILIGTMLFFMPKLRQGFCWYPLTLYGLFVCFGTITFPLAVNFTKVANVVVILSSAPLISAIGAHLLINESIEKKTWIASILIFFAVIVIFFNSFTSGNIVGDLLALTTAMILAAEAIIIRKYKKIVFFPGLFIGSLFTMIVVLPIAWNNILITSFDFLITSLNAISVSSAFFLVIMATRYLTAPEVNLMFLLETVLSPIWIYLVFAEIPSQTTVLVGFFIISILIWHYWHELFDKKYSLSTKRLSR